MTTANASYTDIPTVPNGTFEPVTVPKFERRLDGLSGNVISLYAKGMRTGPVGPPHWLGPGIGHRTRVARHQIPGRRSSQSMYLGQPETRHRPKA